MSAFALTVETILAALERFNGWEPCPCSECRLDGRAHATDLSASFEALAEHLVRELTEESEEFVPDWASAPGETLVDWMNEREMTHTQVMSALRLKDEELFRLYRGDLEIGQELAAALEALTGAPSTFWRTRERHYREALARMSRMEKK